MSRKVRSAASKSPEAGGLTSVAIREAPGGKVDSQSVLADSVGNLIGNSIVAGMGAPGLSSPGVRRGSSSGDNALEEFVPTVSKAPLSGNPDLPFIDTMPDLGSGASNGAIQDLAQQLRIEAFNRRMRHRPGGAEAQQAAISPCQIPCTCRGPLYRRA